MVFSDGFSDTQNKLDPNWSINYLLLQNIVTATEIHNGRKNYFVMSEEYKSLKETRNASPPNGKIRYFYFVLLMSSLISNSDKMTEELKTTFVLLKLTLT